MAVDRQFDDLCDLYDQKSDSELLALHEQRGDLTEVAQQALAQIITERKLTPSVDATEPHPPEEDADAEDVASLAPDEAFLARFNDAFQCSEALRLLAAAEIPRRVIDFNALPAEEGTMRPQVDMGIITQKPHHAAARQLLQQKMNLFPEAEGTDTFELGGLVSVGIFERADALLVAHALGSAGVSYIWTDGDDIHIEVNAARLEQAHEIAQKALPEEA